MPGLVRKFLVFAAVDALILQPQVHRSQKPVPELQISYGTKNDIKGSTRYTKDLSSLASLEAHGIVGLFTVALHSYLILVTKRKQVAQIFQSPIYVISGVTIIPLSTHAEAKLVLENTKSSVTEETDDQDSDASDSDIDNENNSAAVPEQEGDPITPSDESQARLSHNRSKDSIAQNVISKKGAYGRFAEKWFSKKGCNSEKQKSQGLSKSVDLAPDLQPTAIGSGNLFGSAQSLINQKSPNDPVPEDSALGASTISDTPNVAVALLPKLLRTTRLLLNSQSFYYSYDHDLTRRLGSIEIRTSDVPLYKQVDSQFHWNQWLLQSIVSSGQAQFVLPIMQGFVNQRAFAVGMHQSTILDSKNVDSDYIELQEVTADGKVSQSAQHKDFLVTLISRRSVGRPGLRYLRRGVDDSGNAANYVETEQILSDPAWMPQRKIYSFTQLRGSIPLIFSQSPYSFKPTPLISHSFDINQAAFRKHFTAIMNQYGNTQVALLVDKQGTEANIGEGYEKHVKYLNDHNGVNGQKIGFEWFDFHQVCRGMKFENVSILMDTLDGSLTDFGYVIEENQKLSQSQRGILRTSCMDCLDRTNVVQSACGRWALQKQLEEEGMSLDLQRDASTRWFDVMWADNGDAISKQYASTAALKGDYTRTRKRDYRGALNDFGLTLGRYYNNIVNDFFSQAVIDFLLGRVDDIVFGEFEADMMSADPGMSVSKVRQNAVDISVKIVVEDHTEELRGGWVVAAPHTSNTLYSTSLDEVVLLITDAALYTVRFNWVTEKVSAFERVELKDIVRIYRGTYITNTLSNFQIDPKRNIGFIVEYQAGTESNARVNTRSMSTSADIQIESGLESQNSPMPEKPSMVKTVLGTSPSKSKEETGLMASVINAVQTATSRQTPTTRILAFKALPPRTGIRNQPQSADDDNIHRQKLSEAELIKNVCEEIAHMAQQPNSWVEERDVVSLADARKHTGIIETLEHSLKKLVWA